MNSYEPLVHGHTTLAFGLHGVEPDFDPLYALVLMASLADGRPAPAAPATLLLSTYLEGFIPRTTPLLPDLCRCPLLWAG